MSCHKQDKSCDFYSSGECVLDEVDSTVRPIVIAIDLDGTILRFDKWKGPEHFGEPLLTTFWGKLLNKNDEHGNPMTMHPKTALQHLRIMGCVIVIWTTRNNTDRISEILNYYEIPHDHINYNPWQPCEVSSKIYADLYIDDRSINPFKPNKVLNKVFDKVIKR